MSARVERNTKIDDSRSSDEFLFFDINGGMPSHRSRISYENCSADAYRECTFTRVKSSPAGFDYYPIVSTQRLSNAYADDEEEEIHIKLHKMVIPEEPQTLSQLDMSVIDDSD
jgi:hypothetical protein